MDFLKMRTRRQQHRRLVTSLVKSKEMPEGCSSVSDIPSSFRRSLTFGRVPERIRPFLFCGEGVVAGDVGEVAGIVEGEYANVISAADLEAVYAAI